MGEESKADESPSNSEAVSSCGVFCERRPDGTLYKCPRGQVFFNSDHAGPIQKLVLGAARNMGHHVPDLSLFERAELFYKEGVLAGVRICGQYAVGVNEEGGLEVRDWATPERPKFTFTGKRGIKPDPSDGGESYVAVLNKGLGAMVRWDLSSQYGREVWSEADEARHLQQFLLVSGQDQPRPEGINPHEVSTAEIRDRIRGVEPESLHRALLPEPLANARELLAVKVSDSHRALIYLIDKSRVEYDLAMIYALAQHCDRQQLEGLAGARGLTLERAKVVWVRGRLTEQAVFVRECVEEIHERNGKTLQDVFSNTLGVGVYQSAFADWVPLSSVKVKDAKEVKAPLLRREIESAKMRLGFPGRGRRRRTDKERKDLRATRERAIREAVTSLCEEAKAERMNEVEAEDMLTPAAVAGRMEKHVSTLYRWLSSSGLDFDAVRNDCLRRAGFRD